jgi:predicted amidophosphoribosyltransferase
MTLRIYCPYCSAEVRNDSNICPSCNLPLDDVATRRLDSNKSPSHKSVSYDSLDDGLGGQKLLSGKLLEE